MAATTSEAVRPLLQADAAAPAAPAQQSAGTRGPPTPMAGYGSVSARADDEYVPPWYPGQGTAPLDAAFAHDGRSHGHFYSGHGGAAHGGAHSGGHGGAHGNAHGGGHSGAHGNTHGGGHGGHGNAHGGGHSGAQHGGGHSGGHGNAHGGGHGGHGGAYGALSASASGGVDVHYGTHTVGGFLLDFEAVGDAFVRTRIAVDFLSLVQLVLWFPFGFCFLVKHATVGLGRRHWQMACVYTSLAVIALVVLTILFGPYGLLALIHVLCGVRPPQTK
jgi:hypothetical protein